MADIALKVNGQTFQGWKQAQVNRGLNAVAGQFRLAVTDRFQGQSVPWAIKPFDECVLEVAGEPIITGYVDEVRFELSATSRSISVCGRDKTADLVDCGTPSLNSTLKILDFAKLAEKVCSIFGISVIKKATIVGSLNAWDIGETDKAFETLEKGARQKGVLMTIDGLGNLVIAKPNEGRCSTAIIEGKNLLSASSNLDAKGLYSEYLVLADGYRLGGDDLVKAGLVKGAAKDSTVTRFRPLTIKADGNMDASQSKRRAQWEKAVRRARSVKVSVKVQGWTQGDGSLWPLNKSVHLEAPSVGITADLLITAVGFTLSESEGQVTCLELAGVDAYNPEPSTETNKYIELINTAKKG